MHTEITNNPDRAIDPVSRFRWAISFPDITPWLERCWRRWPTTPTRGS